MGTWGIFVKEKNGIFVVKFSNKKREVERKDFFYLFINTNINI